MADCRTAVISIFVFLVYLAGAIRQEQSSDSGHQDENTGDMQQGFPWPKLGQAWPSSSRISEWGLRPSQIIPKLVGRDSSQEVSAATLPGYDLCDVKTTVFHTGDNYSIRTFSEKLSGWLHQAEMDRMMTKLNIYGHDYIEIFARDAHRHRCVYTLGLWGFQDEVDIQSHDWNIAILTKKLNKCLQQQESNLTHCVGTARDFMDEPLLFTPGNDTSTPLEKTSQRIVARGFQRFSGTLGSDQVALLHAIRSLQKPTPHDLFGVAVLKMDISSQCKFSLFAKVRPQQIWDKQWVCNCKTFANDFRSYPKFLLEKVQAARDAKTGGEYSVPST
eukprot:TRINITY_DN80802_c0_g1_i1.p1 TRINITY_DN80802_c0_g1~~TRINITY_DN80802_c0_g1_i1.p1  ORF type:complete len:331 (+),score=52.93 TRINITY_DN80802_c0_g1_i1:59-1051(+)